MLRSHSHAVSPQMIALISVAAVIVVIALGAVIYSKMAPPALPVEVPQEQLVPVPTVALPSVAISAPAHSVSIYRSEETLRSWLDEAYEAHQPARVEMLLRILNGRYERRCHELPY